MPPKTGWENFPFEGGKGEKRERERNSPAPSVICALSCMTPAVVGWWGALPPKRQGRFPFQVEKGVDACRRALGSSALGSLPTKSRNPDTAAVHLAGHRSPCMLTLAVHTLLSREEGHKKAISGRKTEKVPARSLATPPGKGGIGRAHV